MAPAPVGILLAAGRGSRFDASGSQDKLLAALPAKGPPAGTVAAASARTLHAVCERVFAVVRPDRPALCAALRATGCEVAECPDAAGGMGHSLAYAIAHAPSETGWIVALADMPYVKESTLLALAAALSAGAPVAAPVHGGRRGNPVAFAASMAGPLMALSGDQGARGLVNTPSTVLVEVDDPGIHMDIDRPSDLG